MNLILLDPWELTDGVARLSGRRAAHVHRVLRPGIGERLQVGVIGGRLGEGEVVALEEQAVVLRVTLLRDPPPRSPVDLLVALPRPKILRRVLQEAASMGVGRVVLLGSYRVEKSYFASPLLRPEAIEGELRLGLEQGRDTVLPRVATRRLFKPFVEDELDATFGDARRLLADPAATRPLAGVERGGARAVVAIGPEGGWTRYEGEQLAAHGFVPFTLGPRALRVDAAVPFVVGQLEAWLAAR